ncbi:4-hydroxy-tetrahydrodipicolinate reductase [Clostridium weizhouense]|uniref:4-hydroxy-tetrahydrodipicolinate reductase n=1 Tax=Clostridium weizhouense TaxID=2859781 RepID=A0ABS7APZ0_9CLOT|nr:4-hydroxy-tetrahydrodipicolinate reductase [Clostridium weizhouense]MBW6410733.1 4-hydroxy-tetrahydrodipicolinate reductase [Clostridium weizhouense]
MVKICLIGLGKTGKEIAKMILKNKNMELVSVLCSPNSSKKNRDLGEILKIQKTDIKIESIDTLEQNILKSKPDIVIDFSNPEATLKNANLISKMKVNMVIGTTGFSEIDLKKLETLATKNHTGMVYAPNITVGINVLMILTKLASVLLNDYDFNISEIHHKNKKDSPSGTALKIATEIENGLKYSGKDINESKISINSIRAGGVVGKHTVSIVGEDDIITISHESFSRKVFALGAIYAINFIQNKIGFYEMSDILCLSKVIEDLYLSQQTNAL